MKFIHKNTLFVFACGFLDVLKINAQYLIKKYIRKYVTGPMKTDLNAGIFESVFIVESDRASFKLQNDTKIDLLATFFPEICSRER